MKLLYLPKRHQAEKCSRRPLSRFMAMLLLRRRRGVMLAIASVAAACLFLAGCYMFAGVGLHSFAAQSSTAGGVVENVAVDPAVNAAGNTAVNLNPAENPAVSPAENAPESCAVSVPENAAVNLDSAVNTAENPAGNRVILITLDKVTYQDLLDYSGPVLASLLEKGGVALLNVNTAASGSESGYLSIGSGARLGANWAGRRAFNRMEPHQGEIAGALYRRHMGTSLVPPGAVLHLYSGVLHRLNEQRPYPLLVGALGEAIGRAGLGAAVLGNADGDAPNRQIAAIAMDSAGVVAYGDVGPALLREDEYFPFGKRCDAGAYLKALESFWEKAAFIAVDWGDTSRIEEYMAHLPYERRGALLRASLQELDQFLLGLQSAFRAGARLILLAPSLPGAAFSAGQKLAPLLYYNPVSPGGGLVVSDTTRLPGLVANIDLAPTILNILDVERPVFLFGAPLRVLPMAGHLEKLAALSARIMHIYNQRPAVIKGYLTAQMVLLLGGMGGLFFRIKQVKVLWPGLFTLLLFPLAALIAPAFPLYPAPHLFGNVLLLVVLTVLLTYFAVSLFPQPLAFFSFTGLSLFGLLAIDLLRGAPWISVSFLGYDPVGGARFYGIGNEYMGIMVGAFILGFGSLLGLVLNKAQLALEGNRKNIPLCLEDDISSPPQPAVAKPASGKNENKISLPLKALVSRVVDLPEKGKDKNASLCPKTGTSSAAQPAGEENENKPFPCPSANASRQAGVQRAAVVGLSWLFIFLSLLLLFLMASPAYGTNFGGAVTAAVALAVTAGGLLILLGGEGYIFLPKNPLYFQPLRRVFGRGAFASPFPRKVLLLLSFMLVTGALLYWLNSATAEAPVSHLGRTLELVRSDGLPELWKIALRKLEMNIKLIRYSLWSRVLFLFIFLVTALYFYPVGLTKKIFTEKPCFKIALGGIIAGSFTAFVVNDSGVVTAATTMLYGGLPLLLLVFQEVFS